MNTGRALRVAVLGFGAIGTRVVEGLQRGSAPGTHLVGVIVRDGVTPGEGKAAAAGVRELSSDDAIEQSDLIVEAAGVEAARACAPRVVAAGKDVLIASIGVLADPNLRRQLIDDGPGRSYFSTGAIGGLDLLAAATVEGGLDHAKLTSRKLPGSIVQPWMSEDEAEALRNTTEAVTVFEGPVTEAITLFPKSLNIGLALAQATGLWDDTSVELIGDPLATLSTHEIHASGDSGDYAFTVKNYPLESNPASSGVVYKAILKGIAALARPSGTLI